MAADSLEPADIIEARLIRISDGQILAMRSFPAGHGWSGWDLLPENRPAPGSVRTDWRVLPDGVWYQGQPWP